MSLEVTINVPGLKELSEALRQLAVAMGGKSVHEQQSTEEVPWRNASVPQQSTTGTVPAPSVPAQASAQPVQASAAVPTSEPTYTRDDLSKAAMQLMDKGMQAQLMQLIQSFGVASLMELSPEHYGNFAIGLRGMGAQI